jgi:hypothetical protein
MAKYAKETNVTPAKSRAEIEDTLTRYGAKSFMYGVDETRAMIAFEANGKRVKFVLPMPDRNDPEIRYTPGRNLLREKAAWENAYQQAIRQRWRALTLVIKAKLEAVEIGISEFEEEFLAHIMLPDGSTVGEYMIPQVEQVYLTGNMPPMLPMLGDGGNRQ